MSQRPSRVWRRRLYLLILLCLFLVLNSLFVRPVYAAPVDLFVGSGDWVLRYDGLTGVRLGYFEPDSTDGAQVREIAFGPDGNLYVAANYSNMIYRYNVTTGLDMGVFASGGGLVLPLGIAFGPDDNLYVVGQNSNQIHRYDGTTGAFMDLFTSGYTFDRPADLAFGPDCNLYVSNVFSDEIVRFNGSTGAFIDVFVVAGSGGVDSPTWLTFGLDNNLYVISADGNVLRYNGNTGTFMDIFVPAGSGGMSLVLTNLIFGPDGNLYISDSFFNQILRFDGTTGAFIDIFIDEDFLNRPTGLAFFAGPPEQVGPVFTVNTTDVPGDGVCTYDHCTYPEAITLANRTPNVTERDTIRFEIPNCFNGICVIATSEFEHFPGISDPVLIDGLSQPGIDGVCPLASGRPLGIELNGGNPNWTGGGYNTNSD